MPISLPQVFAWLVANAASVPLIYTKLKAVVEADGIVDRWAAFKEFGDVVVPLLDSFPTVTAMSEGEAEATFEAQGLLDKFKGIKEMLPALLELIALLRSIGVLKS